MRAEELWRSASRLGREHDQHAVVPLPACVRGRRVVDDKGFNADIFRARLHTQRARCCIPPKRGRRQPARLHRGYYRCRHQIENFFGRIKIHRRISTRYEKLAETFLGFVFLAAILALIGSLIDFANTPSQIYLKWRPTILSVNRSPALLSYEFTRPGAPR